MTTQWYNGVAVAAWAAGLLGAESAGEAAPLIGAVAQVADYTALIARTGDALAGSVFVAGSRGGIFTWATGDQSVNITADVGQGLWVAPSSASTGASGAWKREIPDDGAYSLEWFGTAADWALAFNRAAAMLPVNGGTIRLRPGNGYNFNSQCYVKRSLFALDCTGAIVRPRNTGGATFKFGDGASVVFQNRIIGGIWDHGEASEGAPEQYVFELRGVNQFRTEGMFGINFYQFVKWGVPGDAVPCYHWHAVDCAINARKEAQGGTGPVFIDGDGAEGGLYLVNSFFESDAENQLDAITFFRITAAQQVQRFDGFSFASGLVKGFDYGVKVESGARLVNYEEGKAARYDDIGLWSVWIDVQSATTQGGCEDISIAGKRSGFYRGGGVYINNEHATIDCQKIYVSGMHASYLRKSAVYLNCTAAGGIAEVEIQGVGVWEYRPDATTDRPIYLSGPMNDVTVNAIGYSKDQDAANEPDYLIYNDTPTTARVKIGNDVRANLADFGTGAVYDPNIGDLSIGRYCAIHEDGTQRRSHSLIFTRNNVTGNSALQQLGIDGNNTFQIAAPMRGRVIHVSTTCSQALTAGTLVVGLGVGASIHADLRTSYASGDPLRKSARLPAGSVAYARDAAIEVRCTTDAAYLPVSNDVTALIQFEEM